MIRINDAHAVNIIARAANVKYVPQMHHCIAEYNSHDQLVGGILYTDWNQGSLLMHSALLPNKGILGRQLLWLGFQYPFIQLGIKKANYENHTVRDYLVRRLAAHVLDSHPHR